MKFKSLFLSLFFTAAGLGSYAQIAVTNTQSPEQLVQDVLVGSGITVSNVTFNGSVALAGSVHPQAGYFNSGSTTFPIAEGVILATGHVNVAVGPNTMTSATDWMGMTPGGVVTAEPDLSTFNGPGVQEYDMAVLEFDFVPIGDSLAFQYIFASEEYAEFVSTGFNDAFGFFISGPGITGPYSGGAANIALVPGTATQVTINNVNNGQEYSPAIPSGPCTNCAYYVHNENGTAVEFDAHTTVMTASASVICGETYHIKMAICDAGDGAYDSGVFLQASSFSSSGANVTLTPLDNLGNIITDGIVYEGCTSFDMLLINPPGYTDSSFVVNLNIFGTATNGTDYSPVSTTYIIPPGSDSLTVSIDVLLDGLAESVETMIFQSYFVTQCGDTVFVSDTLNIIDVAPSFNVLTNDIILDCPTPSVDITATTDGGLPILTYNWGTAGTGQTVDVPGNIPGTTTYNVTVTDGCGIVSTGSVDVILTPGPTPTINFNCNTVTICPDENTTIIGTLVNPYSPTITYDWNPGTGATNTVTVSPNVTTWYYLTTFDGCYTITDSVKVEIGSIDLTAINVTDATNCPGQPAATPGSIEVLPDDPDFTYTLIGGGSTFGPTTNNIFPNLNGGVIYFLNVQNSDGCEIDTAVEIGLGANAVLANWLPASLQNVTCFGDLNGAAAISNITGGITAPYDITWTHTSGLYDQTTVNVNGGDAINNLMGGNWVVTVTDQEGCAWSHLFNIFEPAELTVNFISNDPTCYLFQDGSVTASTTGGNGGNIFTMTNEAGTQLNQLNSNTINQLGTGWYYTTIVDNKGCTAVDSIFVDQPGELDVDLSISQPLCYGVETGLATADTVYNYNGSYGSIGYFWNPNPSGNNGIGYTFSNHMGPGNYVLTIQDQAGCSKTFDFNIAYPPQLELSEFGSHPAYCRVFNYQSGGGVVFAAATGGTGDHDYLWTNNGTGQTSTNTTWGGLNPGSYTISVTDDNGCILTQTMQLDSVNPISDFTVSSAEFLNPGIYEGTAVVCVEFVNTSQNYVNAFDPSAEPSFFWTLNKDNGLPWTLTHDFTVGFDTCYTSEGVYTVCLTTVNHNGCVDTACVDLIIHDPLRFTPVNVFSPNGDGSNDGFTFEYWSQAVETFQCTIVNRWGVIVHEMDNITDVWDGTDMNGDPCTAGIYFYTYSGVATNGTEFDGQGFTHIIN